MSIAVMERPVTTKPYVTTGQRVRCEHCDGGRIRWFVHDGYERDGRELVPVSYTKRCPLCKGRGYTTETREDAR